MIPQRELFIRLRNVLVTRLVRFVAEFQNAVEIALEGFLLDLLLCLLLAFFLELLSVCVIDVVLVVIASRFCVFCFLVNLEVGGRALLDALPHFRVLSFELFVPRSHLFDAFDTSFGEGPR